MKIYTNFCRSIVNGSTVSPDWNRCYNFSAFSNFSFGDVMEKILTKEAAKNSNFRVDQILLLFQSIRIHPAFKVALNNLGSHFGIIECYDLAKKYFQMSLKIDPNYETPKQNLKDSQKWSSSRVCTNLLAKI